MVSIETNGNFNRRIGRNKTVKAWTSLRGFDKVAQVIVELETGDTNSSTTGEEGITLPSDWRQGMKTPYFVLFGNNDTGYTATVNVKDGLLNLWAVDGARYTTAAIPSALNGKKIEMWVFGVAE